jgi:site-specific recombinase XerD
MSITDSIVSYRRFLKRKNFSFYTVKNYINTLKHYVVWLDVPIEKATSREVLEYIDHLLDRRLSPKTINCHLNSIRRFYDYLRHEEGVYIQNPVKSGYALRLPKPLPRYVKEEDLNRLFKVITKHRDRAMFMLMLRCGLRVEEVVALTVSAVDLPRRKITVQSGKGMKDRVVYISSDASQALARYLKVRPSGRASKVFLVEKGACKGHPISVRGVQKRMEYYARKGGIDVSCHQLRHTMATQLLNAEADLVTIQDLLGHSCITTTQRYCKVSNLKVQRDYFKAIEKVTYRLGHIGTAVETPSLHIENKMTLDNRKKETYKLH